MGVFYMINAINVDCNISDDENLSYIYFEFEDFKYFTITINKDEDDFPYIELNEQSFSIQSKNFEFKYDGNGIEFLFDDEIKYALCVDNNLYICLKSIDNLLIQDMIKVLNYILE